MTMAMHYPGSLFLFCFFLGFFHFPVDAAVKKYPFDIQVKNVSRLCHAKPIVTVNGMFPGPTIYVREGDHVIINVTNYAQYNISTHWHGLKQFRNCWADGLIQHSAPSRLAIATPTIFKFRVTEERYGAGW